MYRSLKHRGKRFGLGKEISNKVLIMYIANSSGIKVGITRKTQGVTRWMDQG